MAKLDDMTVDQLTTMAREVRANIEDNKALLKTIVKAREDKENLVAAGAKLNELRKQYGVQTLAALGVPSQEKVAPAGAG